MLIRGKIIESRQLPFVVRNGKKEPEDWQEYAEYLEIAFEELDLDIKRRLREKYAAGYNDAKKDAEHPEHFEIPM